jgi:cellulose biosynthesis protein BcsQ
MRTISICATKGGTGKSTLCVTLATYVHGLGKTVCLIDLDAGQGSTTAWAAARARAKLEGSELIKIRSLRGDLRRLAAKGVDYVFADSPPTLDDAGLVEDAVAVADCVLSPCRPSILDIGAAQTIANLAADIPIGFILADATTGAKWDAMNKEAFKALKDVGHVFKTMITHRPAYVDNLAIGKTGPETDRIAAREIAALWEEVTSWMT